MNVAVVGSRSFNDYKVMCDNLAKLSIKKIVSGGAEGADKLAEKYAKENNIETLIFLPDWAKHGKAAGPIRNEDIVKNADIVIAFWDGKSLGTKNSIDIANRLGKQLIIVNA